MKRTLCVMLLLVLAVPVLLIPASASEVYVFEYLDPQVSFLAESITLPLQGDTNFVYEGRLPEGRYSFSLVVVDQYSSSLSFEFPEPLVVAYTPTDDGFISKSFGQVISRQHSDQGVSEKVLEGELVLNYISSSDITLLSLISNGEPELLSSTCSSAILTPIYPMEVILGAFDSLTSCVKNVFQLIAENPLLASFAAAGLVILCVPIFISLKKASH